MQSRRAPEKHYYGLSHEFILSTFCLLTIRPQFNSILFHPRQFDKLIRDPHKKGYKHRPQFSKQDIYYFN